MKSNPTSWMTRAIARMVLFGMLHLPMLGATGGSAVAQQAPALEREPSLAATPAVDAVARIAITVADLDRAIEFYMKVLAFEVIDRDERVGTELEHLTGVFGARVLSARLRLGEEVIELIQFLAPEGRPIPRDSRSNDAWFQHIAIVVSDIDRAYAHLRQHRVRHASTGPQTLPKSLPNAADISAFYFKDADGHVLEVIHFPPGKGDPRWQELAKDRNHIFLGIDHTAIVVADTDTSVQFYRDTLGLRVAGGSENFGNEQEHLNNVFGARLRITTLKAPRGPGVELLEYLAPSDGRPYPADSRANDLWHWRTVLEAPDAAGLAKRLDTASSRWVSPGLVASGTQGSGANAMHVRDPDGHAVLIEQAPAR